MNKRYIDFVPAKRKPASQARVASPKVSSSEASGSRASGMRASGPRAAGMRASGPRAAGSNISSSRASWQDETEYMDDAPVSEMFAERATPAGVSTGLPVRRRKAESEVHPKFVKTEVDKRPLSGRKTVPPVQKSARPSAGSTQRPTRSSAGSTQRPTRSSAGSTQKSVRTPVGSVRKPARTSVATPGATRPASATPRQAAQGMAKLQPTQAKFLNTNKIVKRPLSKNTYTKPPVTPLEESTEIKKEKSKKPVVIIAKPEKDSKVGLIVAIIVTIVLGAAAGSVAFLLLPK